jgi:hypothetical protein
MHERKKGTNIMSKTIDTLLTKRYWIAHIDDERSIGNSIIVTLRKGWHFADGDKEGVRGFDTLAEVKADTKFDNVVLHTLYVKC